jgi:hypothetical protein
LPSPIPSATLASEIVAAFLAGFVAEDPPFHVESGGRIDTTAGLDRSMTEFYFDGDIAGEDAAYYFEYQVDGGDIVGGEAIVVDGEAYGRNADGGWDPLGPFVQTQPLNPFVKLTGQDIEYIGPVNRDGRLLHQLRTTTWVGEDPQASTQIEDAEVTFTQFDIFVDDKGVPVEADLRFAIEGRFEGRPAEFDYEVFYVFSKVGGDITIERP